MFKKPAKSFAKSAPKSRSTLSLHKSKSGMAGIGKRVSPREIDDMVLEYDLNEDAREKLRSLPPRIFDIIKTSFKPPAGCDNNSGMLIGFASSVCKKQGVRQTKFERRGDRDEMNSYGKDGASDVDEFCSMWSLYPKCGSQLEGLPKALRTFTMRHFRSTSEHTSEINSQFQDFVHDLSDIEGGRTDDPYYDDNDKSSPLLQQLNDFCDTYNLNDDARKKLESVSERSLEIVMDKFKLPDGATECNGIVINFANAVEKKSKAMGRGSAPSRGGGRRPAFGRSRPY